MSSFITEQAYFVTAHSDYIPRRSLVLRGVLEHKAELPGFSVVTSGKYKRATVCVVDTEM